MMRTIPQEASISAKSSIGIIVSKLIATGRETLTAKANPGATVEWHEAPSDISQLGPLPSFGSEIFGVIAIEVLSSMHVVYGIRNACSPPDQEWRVAIRTTAVW